MSNALSEVTMRTFGWLSLALVACTAKTDGPHVTLDTPSASALPLEPGLVCNEQLSTTVTVHGDGLSPMPVDLAHDARIRLPTLALARASTVVGAPTNPASATYSGESDGANGALLSWVDQQTMRFVVDSDVVRDDGASMLPPGIYDARVTNPNGHGATSVGALAVVPRPTLGDVAPGIVCLAEEPRTLTLTGEGLVTNDGVGPYLYVGDMQRGAPVVASACTPIAHAGLDAATCTAGTAQLAADLVDPGLHLVSVTNPETAACISTEPLRLRVVPPPIVSGLEPSILCTEDSDRNVIVRGVGFLRIDGVTPTVEVSGRVTTVAAMTNCSPIETEGHVVESCTALELTLSLEQLVVGAASVVVTNPDPAGCSATAEAALAIVAPPEVSGVVPDAFCQSDGGEVTISGAGFAPTAQVHLERNGQRIGEATTVFVSASELRAVFAGGLPAGVFNLVVDNGAGCADVLPLAVEVERSPLVLFVDPPVVFAGITVEATIYVTGLTSDTVAVALIHDDTRVALTAAASSANNRIQAVIPAGLAEGLWDVEVTSDVGCVGTLPDGLRVTADASVTISAVDPAFAWTGQATAITLTSDDGDFLATPRAYLNPKGAPAGTPATGLRAVLFDDATTLTGVVPRGLAPDQAYEIIVVNPDGSVGVFDALVVTSDPPPTVTAIAPASLDGNEPQVATIHGSSFATDGITAEMSCRDPSGAEHGPLVVTPIAATLTTTSFDATFPVDQVPTGSVCVVTVTNPDGAAFRYSALSTKTPAQNLAPWRPAPSLVEARRGLGLVAQRPTSASRFVYAVGGDDGTTAGAKATIEASSVDLFGDMNVWSVLPRTLPGPRTLAGVAALGRYVYVVGGNDGTSPVATVWRALVLDPLASPEVVDVGVSIDEEAPIVGIAAGTWVYRVAATFPGDDPANPRGESLAGEPFVAQLPAIAGLGLVLRWDAIPGASGYRVYRTREGSAPDGPLELIATTTITAFNDTGASTTPSELPLPPGSLGEWHPVASLTSAREAAAVAMAPDPDDADRVYLYAFGGRDASGPHATWERAAIDITPPVSAKAREQQTVAAWQLGTGLLDGARAEAGAWSVGPRDGAANGTWLFIGSGRGSAGVIDAIDAGRVMPGGDLGDANGVAGLVRPSKRPPASAGYGFGVANGFLFVFGGANGGPSDNGVSGELCLGLGVGGCNPDALPQVRNWNSLGISLDAARYLPGSAQESAFFFIAGGTSDGGVTATVETTVQ